MLERLAEIIEMLLGYGATPDKAVETAAEIARDEFYHERAVQYQIEATQATGEGE